MRKYFILSLFTIFLLTSFDILSQSSIEYAVTPNNPITPDDPITLGEWDPISKYKTDFETVTKVSEHHLDLSIPHNFYFEEEGGASFWVEGVDRVDGPAPHSGSRSIGMELTDITKSRRNEFNIYNMRSIAGDDVLVSVWLYLPFDWGLHAPSIDWNWYELAVPLGQTAQPFLPYIPIHIGEQGVGGGSGIFDAHVRMRGLDNVLVTLDGVTNFPLPRGRWFNLKWELHRKDVDSSIKVWLDNQLICDASGFDLPLVTGEYKITIGKIYHNTGDTTPHYLWIDDLQIFSVP